MQCWRSKLQLDCKEWCLSEDSKFKTFCSAELTSKPQMLFKLFKSACRTCSTLVFPHSANQILNLWRCRCIWRRRCWSSQMNDGEGMSQIFTFNEKKKTMISARSECPAFELFVLIHSSAVLWETTTCNGQIWNPVEHVNEGRLNSTFCHKSMMWLVESAKIIALHVFFWRPFLWQRDPSAVNLSFSGFIWIPFVPI